MPRKLVWDAHQKLALWWGQPGSTTAGGDVRPASSCTLSTREPDGRETRVRLAFESVEPVEFLTFAHYGHDDREGQPQFHVRIDLNDIIQCGTRVTYTLHSDGIGQGDRSYFVGLTSAEEALARLASMLAADPHH